MRVYSEIFSCQDDTLHDRIEGVLLWRWVLIKCVEVSWMCKDDTYILIFLILLKKTVMFTVIKRTVIHLISSQIIIIGHSRMLDEEQRNSATGG